MTTPLRLGIAGLGTVGIGVVKIIQQHADLLSQRSGRDITISAVSARSRDKDRGADLSAYSWEDDPVALATRDDVDVFQVAETMIDRGWLPGLTRNPKGFHSMMSLLHDEPRKEFLADLAWATDKVKAGSSEEATIEATY